ncbi:MAG: HTTM domain-containing protein [Acidimicrobiales bacterium]
MSPLRRLDGWLLAPAPAERLAAFRVLAGGFALVYFAVRSPALWALTRRPDDRFEAVGVLSLLDQPPSRALVAVSLVLLIGVGAAFVIGWRFEVTGPAFAVIVMALGTFHSSWGQLLHFENLMVLHVVIIGFSPAACALTPFRRDHPALASSTRFGWPLRLASIVTVAAYLIAGVAKLRIGGTEWLVGDTLRNHVAYSAARLDLLGGTATPVAELVIDWAWLFPPLAIASVIIELLAPLALAGRTFRNLWVGATITMHLAILALLAVFFPYQALGFAFAPLFALEVGVHRLRSLARRPPVDRAILSP